jgi:hypothetical protein
MSSQWYLERQRIDSTTGMQDPWFISINAMRGNRRICAFSACPVASNDTIFGKRARLWANARAWLTPIHQGQEARISSSAISDSGNTWPPSTTNV